MGRFVMQLMMSTGRGSSVITAPRLHALLSLMVCLLLGSARAASKRSHVDNDPGIVMFSQGDNALSWDSDAISRIANLQGGDISDAKAFAGSSSLGEFLGFSPVRALHMAVPVNVVFLGFSGDGNMRANITTEQLQAWFGHLDHVLPHTRVELAELTCAEDGHCTGLVHGWAAPQPVPSFVHLNFSCNVVVTRREGVLRTFERALHAFSRPVDPEIETGAQQVDAELMERFVDSFLEALDIASSGYTLLVLNPKWSVSEPLYGYRMGMSQPEIDVLPRQLPQIKKLLALTHEEPALPGPSKRPHWFSRQKRHHVQKFGATDLTANSEAWVASVDKYLAAVEDHKKRLLKAVGPVTGAAAVAQAVTLMRRIHAPFSSVLATELLVPEAASAVYSKFRTMHPAEDCLVGNWVSRQRWVLLDLTAGGFDWGPALGGEGVVHKHTLPSVLDHFSHLAELRKDHLNKWTNEASRQVERHVQGQVEAAQAARVNSAFRAFSHQMEAQARAAANAPGEFGAKGETGSPAALSDEERSRAWEVRYQETVLKAELDVYAEHAARHCQGLTTPSRLCERLRTAANHARDLLAKLAGAQASTVDVWRDVPWNVFSDEAAESIKPNYAMMSAATRARQLFLAQVNDLLSRALRHVVVPPTATWTHAAGYLHDTSTPLAKTVLFTLYVLHDVAHVTTEHREEAYFDVDGFKRQVERLALPSQTFTFNVQHLGLADDEVLAVAVAAAQRSAAQEIPTTTETVQNTERVYLDTRVLAHVLRQRFQGGKGRTRAARETALGALRSPHERLEHLMDIAAHHHHHTSQTEGQEEGRTAAPSTASATEIHEVPVFVFELHRDTALLLDEHYNAKALEDMIVVVQNAAREDEHPTGMMCGGALVARPLSPLREALAAVLTHLGGLLPPHLGYDPRRERVTHDWLWSVGSHPTSFTSLGTEYTEMQVDAVARTYVLDAVDSAVDAVNEGIAALRATRSTPMVYAHAKAHKAAIDELTNTWAVLVQQWQAVLEASWRLSWHEATVHLAYIQDKALRFRALAMTLTRVPPGAHCAGLLKPTTEHLVFPALAMSIAVAGAALLWLLLPALGSLFGRGHARHRDVFQVKF